MDNFKDPMKKIDSLVAEYSNDMELHVANYLAAKHGSSESEARENFLLYKIATLVVGMEMNRKVVDDFLKN